MESFLIRVFIFVDFSSRWGTIILDHPRIRFKLDIGSTERSSGEISPCFGLDIGSIGNTRIPLQFEQFETHHTVASFQPAPHKRQRSDAGESNLHGDAIDANPFQNRLIADISRACASSSRSLAMGPGETYRHVESRIITVNPMDGESNNVRLSWNSRKSNETHESSEDLA
eukprot:GEMP01086326.1.p1 GENE.GEMP01086326.1~~GEMP01086326.1.p1  ORF type:complete len:171 (+),score=29.53 GEMP01086326.1:148-660(+)